MDKLPIVEIFASINGEGPFCGLPSIFIRTAGCNLRCSYCDTTYSFDEYGADKMSIAEILNQVMILRERYNIIRVTLTGGEPMIHGDRIRRLLEALYLSKFNIEIETNGTDDIRGHEGFFMQSNSITVTMDYKCESSGIGKHTRKNSLTALSNLKSRDAIKFVVGDKMDLLEMRELINDYYSDWNCHNIFVSPVFGSIEPKEIVEYILNHALPVRMQLQLHKFIWPPEMRGV